MTPLSKVCGDIAYYGFFFFWWGGMFQKVIGKRVVRIVKEAGKILDVSRQDFGSVYTDLLINKLPHVVDDVSNPLHDRLSGQLIARSGRMRLSSDAYLSSFVPQAIRHHNANNKRSDDRFEMHLFVILLCFEHLCLQFPFSM